MNLFYGQFMNIEIIFCGVVAYKELYLKPREQISGQKQGFETIKLLI